MGMPWFRVNTGWEDHPKVQALADKVKRDGPLYALRLWEWTARFYPSGKITADARTMERALRWKGQTGVLFESMVSLRLVDGESGNFEPHDWTEHNGAAFHKWESDRNKRKPPKPATGPIAKPSENPSGSVTVSVAKPPPTNVTNVTKQYEEQMISEPDRREHAHPEERFQEDTRPEPPPIEEDHPAAHAQIDHGAKSANGSGRAIPPDPPPMPVRDGPWPGAPAGFAQNDVLKGLWEHYHKLFDPNSLNGPDASLDALDKLANALRADALAGTESEPGGRQAALTEVMTRLAADPYRMAPANHAMRLLRNVVKPENIAKGRAIVLAQKAGRPIDPPPKGPPPKPQPPPAVYWEPEDVPGAGPRPANVPRPKFMQGLPTPEVKS